MVQTFPKPQPRPIPTANVTRIASLMAGESQCTFRDWLLSNYAITPKAMPANTDSHDRRLRDRAKTLKQQNFSVAFKKANAFQIKGQTFNLNIAGCPNLIATQNDSVIIEDIQSGQPQASHRYQIMLYLFLLPYVPAFKQRHLNRIPHGRLIYPHQTIEISAASITHTFIAQLHQVLARLTQPEIPIPRDTPWECQRCNLPDRLCSLKLHLHR